MPLISFGQTRLPQGGETGIIGGFAGDQDYPSVSLNQDGGYVVWEGMSIGKTNGIGAARLDASMQKVSIFPVSKITKGTQRTPQVKMLSNGNAIFVWSGNALKTPDIYARILKEPGVFLTSDLRLNTYLKDSQTAPVVTSLENGGAFVVWSSFQQDGSLWGIYARTISPDGKITGNEFGVNQTTQFNQRSPAIATLSNGNVVAIWISEQQRFAATLAGVGSVDVYARIFNSIGSPLSGELLLNSGNNPCADPSISALPGGGFTVVWSEKDLANRSNNWEVVGRSFSESGTAVGGDFKINSYTYGDQFRPRIATTGNHCEVVWTSLGQDGSREGVFGRILQNGTVVSGDEFRVNTTTPSKQIHPAIASQGDRVLVLWSSFIAVNGFDLFGQKNSVTQ
ncbi:MAG: hypothetical protein ABIV39_08250 [Verrucomicrobiota bacterium]